MSRRSPVVAVYWRPSPLAIARVVALDVLLMALALLVDVAVFVALALAAYKLAGML